MDEKEIKNGDDQEKIEDPGIDEDMKLFIYGNLMIRDADTGEILVNQRF
jgi:hypothetical protein